MKKCIFSLVVFLYSASCFSYEWIPERRKDQFPTQSAHLVVPLPYSLPGIGEGVVVLGTLSNILNSTADVTGFFVEGDAQGTIIDAAEIPLYSDFVFLDFHFQDIDRAAVNNYSIRGIDNTNKDDFTILDLSVANETSFDLNLTFYERRLNFYYSYSDYEYQVDAIRDNNGVLISTLSDPYISSGARDHFKVSLDLTDDHQDPRKGFRFDITYRDEQAKSINEPDFYTLDYNLLGYIPFRKHDTLVLNYYQSDAHVKREGNTDPTSIRAELGLNCASTDIECLTTEQELVDNIINARRYGTSASLGGELRLRSFPQGRYQGAHTAFIAAEYRWNITQEATPFDYLFWKDVRTGYQVAFFAEIGTVSETSAQKWDQTRHTIGTGFRLVAASGAVYRADIASGDEGVEISMIFNYPWE